MKQWIARVGAQFSVGGYIRASSSEAVGTVHLNGVMAGAASVDGRELQITIAPDVLDIVAELVRDAIAARDAAKVA